MEVNDGIILAVLYAHKTTWTFSTCSTIFLIMSRRNVTVLSCTIKEHCFVYILQQKKHIICLLSVQSCVIRKTCYHQPNCPISRFAMAQLGVTSLKVRAFTIIKITESSWNISYVILLRYQDHKKRIKLMLFW